MEITIDYKLLTKPEWLHVTLLAEEYFDFHYLDEGELLDIDSISKYDYAFEYINGISRCDVEITKLNISDHFSGKSLTITERFWNGGENQVIERSDSYSAPGGYWELIIDVLVSKTPQVNEILRLGRVSGVITVYLHSFIDRLADGTERIRTVYPPGTSD
jgi:hypothetical protein